MVSSSQLFSQAVASAGCFLKFLSFSFHPAICVFIHHSFVLSFNRCVSQQRIILGVGGGIGDFKPSNVILVPRVYTCCRVAFRDSTSMRKCKCYGGRFPKFNGAGQHRGAGGGGKCGLMREVEDTCPNSLDYVSQK